MGLLQKRALSPAIIEQYRDQYPLGAVLLFMLVYVLSVVATLPSLPLNLAAGFFWGGLTGGIYTAIGVTLGGWLSFLAARWLTGQPLADQFENKWARKVQDEFERNGWKFIAFARINPIIPYWSLELSARTYLAIQSRLSVGNICFFVAAVDSHCLHWRCLADLYGSTSGCQRNYSRNSHRIGCHNISSSRWIRH